MGNELDKLNKQTNNSTDTTGTTSSKPAEGNRSTAAAGSGAAGNSGTGTDRTGKASEEKKLSGLPSVDKEAVPKPEEPKKKATRKKVTKKKKKESEASFNAVQLTALMQSASMIVASRENMQMFALSEEEAKQLATPIANMIEKSEKLSNMGEYADAIALVTACLLIFVPRFLLYADVKKKDKLLKNGGVRIINTEKQKQKGKAANDKTGKINGNNGADAGKSSTNAEANAENIHSVLDAYGGF